MKKRRQAVSAKGVWSVSVIFRSLGVKLPKEEPKFESIENAALETSMYPVYFHYLKETFCEGDEGAL